MVIIPINRPINCERMLKTGDFQTLYWHNEELTWLIRFLRQKRTPKEKIYQIWKSFRAKDKPEYDEEALRENFKSFYDNSLCVVFNDKYSVLRLYQEEIDYINSLPAPLWIRQYIYMLLLHIKGTSNENYDFLPYDDYYRFLAIKNNHSSILKAQLIKKLRSFGIVKNVKVSETYDELPVCNEDGLQVGVENNVTVVNERLSIKLPIKSPKTVVKDYINIMDAIGDMDKYIHSYYKCPVCGATYEFTNRMQRGVCKSCYIKQRNKKAANGMRKLRERQKC